MPPTTIGPLDLAESLLDGAFDADAEGEDGQSEFDQRCNVAYTRVRHEPDDALGDAGVAKHIARLRVMDCELQHDVCRVAHIQR